MAVLSEAAVERPLSDLQSRSPAHRVLLEAPVSYTCAGAPGAGTQVLAREGAVRCAKSGKELASNRLPLADFGMGFAPCFG
jgi:hypothetical protein